MSQTRIPPALTPDEWASIAPGFELRVLDLRPPVIAALNPRVPGKPGRQSSMLDLATERHAVAALCLYQQPFGFTQEDVDLLKRLWASAEELGNPVSFAESNAGNLAARIAALLPPPSSPERP